MNRDNGCECNVSQSGNLKTELVEMLTSKGAALVGVADLSSVSGYPYPTLPIAVSIAYLLNPVIIREIRQGPPEAYIREYSRVNQELSRLADLCSRYLQDNGFQASVIEPTLAKVDREHLYAEFPHKTVATRAGIGWIGKSALLVTREYGSAIRLTTVCTNAPLTAGEPVIRSYCGNCNICTDSCPAKAPSGRNWEPSLHRDSFWNADACFLQCEETQKTRHVSSQVCGICIAVCPYTQRFTQ